MNLALFSSASNLRIPEEVVLKELNAPASGLNDVNHPDRLMSRQLKTFIMQTLMFAALIVTGLSVQASHTVAAQGVQMQAHCVDAHSDLGVTPDDMALMSGTFAAGDVSTADCEMDDGDCPFACAMCAAVHDPMPVLHPIVATRPLTRNNSTVIAAQYPIYHPPKPLSSI